MPINAALHKLQALQKKWQWQWLLLLLSQVLFIVIIAVVMAHQQFTITNITFVLLIWLITMVLLFKSTFKQITLAQIAGYLNQHFPELEESAELILLPPQTLPLLQHLQVQKISPLVLHLQPTSPFKTLLRRSLAAACIPLALLILLTNSRKQQLTTSAQHLQTSTVKDKPILPQITNIVVTVTPPSYTKQPVSTLQQLQLTVIENTKVQWRLITQKGVRTVSFIFNDTLSVPLQPDSTYTNWTAEKRVQHTGFYRVNINGKVSTLYQLQVLKDQPPTIVLSSPKPTTVIDFGQPKKIPLFVTINDDYGITNAYLNVTIASGSGEAVKFKEQKMALANNASLPAKQYIDKQVIDLNTLQLQPGDEMYGYISATDNLQQETKSSIFIVRLPDTAQLMSFDGMINGVAVKPEFFRSERQVIIDAEQLIKDKDTISITLFNERCNNLGVDQKLLRLRYGKFLGEENESDIGAEADESLDAADFGDATKMIDAYTDKHDNAEDPTFLDAETKKRLKAVLNEMWKAELQLRTFKPAQALPFAYKALRLLKDLQQQSRVFVAKAAFKTTALKSEKRLTGELSKIKPPTTQLQVITTVNDNKVANEAIALLQATKEGHSLNANDVSILLRAAQLLQTKAAAQPAIFLAGYEAVSNIIQSIQQQRSVPTKQVNELQLALHWLLTTPYVTPQKMQTYPNNLSQPYFLNLQNNQQ